MGDDKDEEKEEKIEVGEEKEGPLFTFLSYLSAANSS